jgi:hypothetical protein
MEEMIKSMLGKWSGLGQTFDFETNKVMENIALEVEINRVNNNTVKVVNKFTFVQETRKNRSNELIICFLNESEFEFQPAWTDKAIVFTYMINPISFQGSYLTKYYGDATKTLNNNFIVDNQWQINIEREKDSIHTITEFMLEKES